MSFNGANDYLITPNLQSSFSTTSVTVELWFKANAPGVILDELGSTTVNSGWHDSQIEILSSGQVDARVWDLSPVSLGTANFGEWNFVALRYNSSTSTLDGLLNGVPSSTTGSGSRSAPNNGYGLYYAFGDTDGQSLGSGAWLNGSIDDISIWNVARSNSAIQADMSQPPSAPQAGLVADYQLDDGAGLTAADSSGGNHTANLGGGTAANAPAWVTSNAPIDGVVSTGTADTQAAIDHFAVTFNQPLNANSAGAANSYSLTGSSGDPTYVLTPSYTPGSTTVNFTMTPEPLQPGTYSFDTLSGLTDSNGNAVTPFALSFTISNPPDGQIALTTHQTMFVPGATPLPMTQVSTGFSTALGVGTFASTSDPNYWYLNANAGDHVTIRVEAQNPNNSIYPYIYLENVSGSVIASTQGSYYGIAELDNVTIPAPGTYFVDVFSNNNNTASYQMRVDQSEANIGPQLDATPNGSQSSSTFLSLTSSTPGSFGGSVAGALPLGDNGDYYALGTLLAGNAISLTTSAPSVSSLYTGAGSPAAVVLSVEQAGSSTPVATSNTGTLNYTIPSGGAGSYYVVVQAAPNNQGIRAQYLLNTNVVDGVAPTVTSTSLPAPGESTNALVGQFTVNFSETLAAATVTNPANYSLTDSQGNSFALVPGSYNGGLSETLTITNSPLQPGSYTLNVGSGITDRAQNALTPFQLQFGIVQVPGFVTESANDNSPGTATPLATPTSQPDGSFTATNTYSVSGNQPYFTASAALRGAGQPLDLVTANYNSGTISVLLGNGDGTFQAPVTYTVGSNPIAVAIGDLTGNGTLDIAVANYGSNTISVLLGKGDGTFQTPVTYTVGSNPRGVAIANLNGSTNGNDLVVANWSSNTVSVLLNQGNGTFANAVNYAVGTNPGNLVIADFNGDGKLDVATANYSSNSVSILPGNGNGTFGTQISYATGSGTNPIDVVAVQLTSDGKYDLAAANNGNSTVSVLLNQGTPGAAFQAGSFAAAVSYAAGASSAYHLVAADLTNNGKQDLAVVGSPSSQVGVLLGNGDGTLQAATTYSTGSNPIGITAGDFNGDGIPDLVASNYSGNSVAVLLGNAVKALPVDATTGLASGYGRGALLNTSTVDYFSWTGKAGDVVQVASENPGNPAGTYLSYNIENASGGTLTSFVGNSYDQGQSSPITLPYTGTYLVEVSAYTGYTGEYRFRVTEAPPTLQLVTNYDDSVSSSPNTPTLTNTSAGNLTAQVAGYIGQGDSNGDFFSLGNVLAGTQLKLTLSQPASSTLGGVLNIYNSSGVNETNNVTAGNSLSYTVPAGAGGTYYARVSSASTTTVSFWMNWNGTNNEIPIAFSGYALYFANGSFGLDDNGDIYGISSAGLANSWHLVTAVFVDGSETQGQLWIDGVQQTLTQRQGTPAGAPLVSTSTSIGNYLSGGYGFTGLLDEVAYFDGTLSGAQIQAEYAARNGGNYSATILGQHPVAYYRLGETSGTVAYDSSGNFDNATLSGSITLGVPGAPGNDTAYQFSGGSISAVVPESTGLLGQYVLSIDEANTTSPTITATNLPAQGTTTTGFINQVTLGFSEDMNAAAVNNTANYVLVDGNGNAYHLSNPGYTSGTSATYQITDGPLQPGNYTLTISGLTDRMGNAQNPFSLQFSVASLAGFTNQGRSSDNPATPTALTLTGDPAGTGLFVAGGRGALINNSDVDYWTFSGTSGNLLSIDTQNLNSPGSSGLTYVVTEPNGSTTLTSFTTDSTGNAESAPIALPATGTYTISVHIYYGYYGEYRFRVLSATPPLQLDKEPNNTIATADTLTLAASGNSQVANVAGTILTSSDLNYFNLGTIQAGYSVLISSQLTSTSPLSPVVSVYNASDVYLNKTNGRPFDGVGQFDITQTGTYYALMQGGSATGGLLDQYVMNVQIVPTSSLAQLPNLEVTNISLPSGSNIQSGQQVTFSWTVTNEGQAPTNVANWSDRAVLSLDTTYGNSDDIPLNGSNGVFGHSGVLLVQQSYTATETVTLPDGISGNYHIIVQTDCNDQVNENSIGRGDAVTVSSGGPNGDGTFTVSLAPYADLVVQGLTVNGPNAAGNFSVSWNTVNQGNGAVASNWTEQLVVKDVTTGVTVVNTPLSFSGGLAANGGTDAHTEPLTGSYLVDSAGHFQVTVTTNSDQSIYEDNPQGHANAVANDTSSTAFDATRDLTVTNLTKSSPASPQTGNQVTLTWTDSNTGILATTGGWNDLVTVVDSTTGATLYSANIPYTGASIQPGGTSATLSTSFTLPDGASGVGTITVTVNANNAEAEYNTTGTAGSNNSSSINFASTLANYADLVVASGSLAVTPGSLQSGESATVTWMDKNQGDAAVNGAFNDSVLVQQVNGATLTYITSGTVSGNPSLAAGATSGTQSFPFTLPNGAAGTGDIRVTVTTDSGQTIKEYDSNGNLAYGNNTASTDVTSTLAKYADLIVATGSLAVTPGSLQSSGLATVTWMDKNQGNAAASGSYVDYVLVQRVNPDNSLTYIASGFVSGPSPLAAGTTGAQESFGFTMPDGAAGVGNFRVTVTSDYYETIPEYDSSGNAAYGNNTSSITAASTLANYADLIVAPSSLTVTPGSPQSGGSVTVTWMDKNQGDAAVNGAFNDSVLVQQVNGNNLTYITSGTVSGNPSLAIGATSSTQSYQFTLPNGTAGTGDIRVTVTTDSGQTIKEYDSSGNPAYGNNTASTDVTSTLAPSPDLVVQNIVVNGGSSSQVLPSQTIPVTWNDYNQGTVAANGTWIDQVFLAGNAAGTQNLQLLQTVNVSDNLAALAALAQSTTITIPATDVGNEYVVVETGLSESFFEFNTSNNTSVSSSAITIPPSVTVSLAAPGNRTFNKNTVNPASSATVTRNDTNVGSLTVTITSSNPSAVLLAANPGDTPAATIDVVIPNGAYSAVFYVDGVQDNIVDGTQTSTLNPSASGYLPTPATATELETNTPTLSLTLGSTTFADNAGTTATLTRNTNSSNPNDTALTVAIASSDPSVATAPATVTIPAG